MAKKFMQHVGRIAVCAFTTKDVRSAVIDAELL
jgi:hypothetical protein